ncbi:MAG TPA: caspase family protein [Thermoanaerobaculia bacterium]|nr:caspase family protein [Thermoanaerobaculia bacterium]
MSDLHALLIGIDAYLENRLPDGSFYPQLGGCVRDVSRVEEFLRTGLEVPAERIVKLTASLPEVLPQVTRGNAAWPRPVEPGERWPTYENMVAAFQAITAAANPGDEVYVHYSGHGGRAVTHYPETKGVGGWDEALVPIDIGDPGVRYIRDLEVARLVKDMVDKGLRVTLVFDSCHAGGAVRKEAVPRGARKDNGQPGSDTTPRPEESLVASREDLLASWTGKPVVDDPMIVPGGVVMRGGAMRHAYASDEWLPGVKGFVLLAACRDQESAYECAFDGKMGGALTHWLLDALGQLSPGMTYKDLRERVVAKVHGEMLQQTPMLLGEGEWIVFGSGAAVRRSAVDVLWVDPDGRRLLLNTGQAQGIGEGARFAIYPLGAKSGAAMGKAAVVEVQGHGATESWAEVVERPRSPVEPGAQAFLVDLGADELKSTVRRVSQGSPAGELEGLARQVAAEGGFLRLAGEGDPAEPGEYQVAVGGQGEIEIRDAAGQPVSHLGPRLRAQDPGALREMVARLVHLTRHRFVRQIENFDPVSPLAGTLAVEWLGVQARYVRGSRPAPRPGTAATAAIELAEGEWTFLRIANRSSHLLNLVVLDLKTDWGITQIYPAEHQGSFLPLDDGKELVLPIRGDLPAGLADVTDLIKVFATRGTLDFHWLELPSLRRDESPIREAVRAGTSASGARSAVAAPAASTPVQRGAITPTAFPSEEWVTAQVEMRVRRALTPAAVAGSLGGRSWHPAV